MKKKVHGFTLPEVLVTVTVVAVLAAVVVPAVTQYVGRGNGPAAKSDITQLVNGVTGYVADVRAFPGHLTDLVTAGSAQNWHGPYFSGSISGQTGTTGTSATAFTLGSIGVMFADSVDVNHDDAGYVQLFIATTTTCTDLVTLDTALDGSAPTPSTGRVLYSGTGVPATDCAITGKVADLPGHATLRLMPSGK